MTRRTEQAWNVTKTLGRKMGLHKPYWTILYLLEALSQKTAGDVPVHQDVWETQYAAGKWEYLRHPAELGRYALLEGYIKKLGLTRILDIGCGEGILLEYLWPYAYDLYVGVDVSATALQRAAVKSSKATRFMQQGCCKVSLDSKEYAIEPLQFWQRRSVEPLRHCSSPSDESHRSPRC